MKTKLSILLAFLISLPALAQQNWVDSTLKTLSIERQVAQLFMIATYPENSKAEQIQSMVEKYQFGGIMYLKGNPKSQVEITNKIQSLSKIPMFVSIDGEWGLAMRLSETVTFPRNMPLGAISDLKLIEEYGYIVGQHCKMMGIHINFAPVADINSNPLNPVIGTRSFGQDPQRVTAAVLAYSKGLQRAGVMPVAKHFPGHGDTSTDSHKTLPTINHSRERLEQMELVPFKAYINAGFDGMMVAHLNIPVLKTNGNASSLTPNVVTNLLKKELGFKGLIFTDGLAMKGATQNPKDKPSLMAFLAGNDILLGPANAVEDYKAFVNAVRSGVVDSALVAERCRKVLEFKQQYNLTQPQRIAENELIKRLNPQADKDFSQKLYDKSITLAKSETENNSLPFSEKNLPKILTFGDAFNTFLSNSPKNAKRSTLDAYKSAAADKELIVLIAGSKAEENQKLISLSKSHKLTLVFLCNPYRCLHFKESIKNAAQVVLAYDNSVGAQKAAAKALFKIAPSGILPVEIPGVFALPQTPKEIKNGENKREIFEFAPIERIELPLR